MRWIRMTWLRLRAIFRRPALEREMEAEMAEHLASETEELVRRGMTESDARRQAQATMGRMGQIQEECRDARGVGWWDDLRQDVGFAARLLVKSKTFTAVALGTIALGIGSTTAVFSMVDTLLIRPLPFREPERLVTVNGIGMRGPFEAMRTRSRVADYAAHQGVRAFNLIAGEGLLPDRVKGSEVSANFFAVLGVPPAIGRTFDGPRGVVLSHAFWLQRYGGRADAVGRQLVLDEVAYEIVGVMPKGFRFPSADVQVWTPLRLDPRLVGEYWGQGGTEMIARLRNGKSLEMARAELRMEIPRIRAMFPWRMPDAWGSAPVVTELRNALVSEARLRSWLLFGVAGFVLLIAVVNVTNLIIGQTAARVREIALRSSLGATPRRLARQLLTEALLLAAAGGALGAGLGYGLLGMLRQLLPATTPRLTEMTIDGRILMFTAAVSLLSGALFGLWPAWRARHQRSLTTHGDRIGGGGVRVVALLVMSEAAFATVLLVGTGLLLRSLWTMLQIDPGFRVESVVTAELSPAKSVASSPAKAAVLWDGVRQRLERYPGVRGVAAMSTLPLTPEIAAFAAAIEDHPLPEKDPQYVLWTTSVTPEHLAVLNLRLLEGRGFTQSDDMRAQQVVMISRSTARRFWPDRSPVGKRLKPVFAKEWRTIVGVVDDVKAFGINGPPAWSAGEVYLPMAQAHADAPMSLIARLDGDSSAFEQGLGRLVHEVCATCAVSKVARMERIVAHAVETPRSTAWLVGGFAALALAMAAAGIYGVVNNGVIRRTRELGVRLALGAGRGRVAALVIGSSLSSVGAGAVLGLGAAWLLARLIRNILYGVIPHDPVSFLAGPAVLLMIALAASAAPALRAIRIDPALSLRDG
jgi:putative ABC transport system permease protein